MDGLVLGEIFVVAGGIVGVGLGLTGIFVLTRALLDGTLVPRRAEKWDYRHVLFPLLFASVGVAGVMAAEGPPVLHWGIGGAIGFASGLGFAWKMMPPLTGTEPPWWAWCLLLALFSVAALAGAWAVRTR